MGSKITFRYANPKHAGRKDVILLTSNYMGNLHGLKVARMNLAEQEYVQDLLAAVYADSANVFASLQANVNLRYEAIQKLNLERADLIRQQRAVTVIPADRGMLGAAYDKTKSVLGSVIGKIKTFGRTETQTVPANNQPELAGKLAANQQAIEKLQEEVYRYNQFIDQEKERLGKMGPLPKDPYRLYHYHLKKMFDRQRIPTFYRKYKVGFIRNDRILSRPPGAPIGT